MKKYYRAASAAITALCLTAASVLPAAAGTLSSEELFRKYDHSAYLTDENGDPIFTPECWTEEAFQRREYEEVRTCGYDTSYAETIEELPVKVRTIETETRKVRYEDGFDTSKSWSESYDDLPIGADPAEMAKIESRQTESIGEDGIVLESIVHTIETLPVTEFSAYRYRDMESGEFFYRVACSDTSGVMYIKKDDHACIVGLDENLFNQTNNDTLTIPETLGGLPVTEIENGAFWYPESEAPAALRRIVLPDTVEVIGWHAFDSAILDCADGASIHMPASLKAIYPYGFRNVGHYLDTNVYPESLEYLGRDAVSQPAYTCDMKLPESLMFMEEKARLEMWTDSSFEESYEIIDGQVTIIDSVSEEITKLNWANDGALRLTDAAKYYLMQKKDINGDGETDVKDAVLLSRIVGGDTTVAAEDVNSAAGDVNGNGKTDAEDLTLLLRQLAKLA